MDFNFTEEQSMVRDTVASFLQDKYDFETRRKIVASESGWRADYWKAFAEELGILGASFSEELGGLGGGAIDNMIIMEEFGKALVIEPYLGTVVIGGGFMKHSGYAGAASVIEGIVGGTTTIAFAYAEPQARYTWRDLKTTARKEGAGYVLNGHKAVVVGAPFASHLVVTARTGGAQRDAGGVSVFLIDKSLPGVVTRDYPTVDGGRASEVYFENVSIPADALIGEEGGGLPLVDKMIDEATAAVGAEAVGVLRKLHEGTLDYAKQRKQFGTAISNFQVLQHRMVDMFIEVEQAVSMTYMATIKLDESDDERAKAVSAAKVRIGRACKFVGQNAIQIHGGMGMTDELAIGHYFKRASIIEGLFGSVDHHLKRYESLSFGPASSQAA
ncbi:alkylation response protein AidB-like acyl-CoA dehydrogenase [Caulobacter rhizosphaerae]|uniref:Alkylation response protein AidB-like acyl-CoA dehydrogenase n=1 Tax=Caulobacter rhizosphaerae TaxID=2010972 RepID=A0ABU1MYP2_9CAUL|nr:acyl-CoA dehydrogenase family protein [Caulobacter rhizosphaerae]MDR6531157.1 alkylation response protein AidB-like acyl-CoA dehydrogenase [Caulobacter rhizosphaerae]